MGNCVGLLYHPDHVKARFFCCRGDPKIEPPVLTITNIPPRLFEAHKVAPFTEPHSPPPIADPSIEPEELAFSGNSQFVKIVVTKRELESMLRDGKDIRYIRDIAVRFLEKNWVEEEEACPRKWRPSLATIPEVRRF